MRPELIENSTFLRYNEILRNNPSSIVFAPLAEMLILHKCYEEAIVVCKKGLERNPELVSGRIALARAYVAVKNFRRAREEAEKVLAKCNNHPEAIEIRDFADKHQHARDEKRHQEGRPHAGLSGVVPSSLDPVEDAKWNTVTMAEILVSQGNMEMARRIYERVLSNEPGNVRAADGLKRLEKVVGEQWKS